MNMLKIKRIMDINLKLETRNSEPSTDVGYYMKSVSYIIFFLFIVFMSCSSRNIYYHIPPDFLNRSYTGLENFIDNYIHKYKGKRAVVVTNHSGVDFLLNKNIDLFRNNGLEIAFLLVPEHGLFGYQNKYDKRGYNVLDSINAIVYNLHKLNENTLSALLKVTDIVIFDIQDMGMRCYTYISSLKFIMDIENCEFKEAIQILAQVTGKEI